MSSPQKFTAFNFDASTVPPSAPLEPVPPDFYTVAITDGELKPTKDGSGIRMNLEFTILEGAYKGRKIFDGLNVKNNSAQAQEIAHQQLSAICYATGVVRVTDVQEFYNKPFSAKIGFEAANTDQQTGKSYEAKNTYKGCKPLGAPGAAGVPAGGAAPGGVPAPSWAKPAGGATPPPPAGAATPPPPAAPPFATGGAVPPPAAPRPPTPPPAAPVPPRTEPRLVMTAKANGMTADQFRASDAAWTDELLVREGYATIEQVQVAPPAANTPPGAPIVPPAWTRPKA